MKRIAKRILGSVLVAVMVLNVVFTALPALNAYAAPIMKTMSHLVASEDNGNTHFGGATPEAFVLSDESDITDEGFSFTFKVGAEEQVRFRFVNKYVDDSHWSYIAYDGMNGSGSKWFAEYNNGGVKNWPGIAGLPDASTGDVLTVTGEYTETGLKLTVKNLTQETSNTAMVTDESFLGLKDQAGKIGFGAGFRNTSAYQKTEVYVADVMSGETAIAHSDFSAYSGSAEGFIWEEVQVEVGDDGVVEEEAEARKWIVLSGGSNNGNGHNYGNGNASGPLFYTDTDRTMTSGGTISMALKPSLNWGVFYSYIDDNNWLYVGWDNSSKWYYQYKVNGAENYPKIAGLPDPVEGEEIALTISLSNETLAVTVNDTTVRVTNQALKNLAEQFTASYGNLGKFGVMTKGQTTIKFADFKYDNQDCMDDTWAFNAERDGQTKTEEITATETVTGKVTDENGAAIKGATVRIGAKSATTAIDGSYRMPNVQVGEYAFSVSKPGYEAYSDTITVVEDAENTKDAVLTKKADIDLTEYDTIKSDDMTAYIGKAFPIVARYVMKSGNFFRANEIETNTVVINGKEITPDVVVKETTADSRTYTLTVKNASASIDFVMDVKISVKDNTLTWEVTELKKNDGCAKIAKIDIPNLNLLTVDAAEEESVFAGAQLSTTTTAKADTYITFEDGFIPSSEDGYLYAFLSNGTLSAGLHSNSEKEGDKRVERVNSADSMSLTSAVWYYESGDSTGQAQANVYDYQVSELPQAKVAIADGDLNNDGDVDWNDGAIAFRDVMHYAQGSEDVADMVNYRISMNFESAASNPFLVTADNIKKVYLATDGLPQAVMLKGYGNEGHDSANSEYADVGERLGGIEDFNKLLEIAHEYDAEIGIHVNAQEAYPEAKSFNNDMVSSANGAINGNGWGWLDQSVVINKLWDLSTDARLKRFVQLYDRINGTSFYSGDWEEGEYVKASEGFFTNGDGETKVSRLEVLELVKADSANRPNNMDFIYLDVWYQDSWETRRIAEEINSLGWRFSTEFCAEGEYNSTWQHWATDAAYGGAGMKGLNSDIIRFLRNDQRDSQVLNYPSYGGTADNPLLGGFRLYGFEGWGGDQNFNNYIYETFNQNLPTKFLQHYQVIDWENYPEDESPVGNTEKQITLSNGKDVVVVTRNEEQRKDSEIERVITLNGKVVLNTDVNGSAYLLPWFDEEADEVKYYHWNIADGETEWELQADWANLDNVYVYRLTDQGRVDKQTVAVVNGKITLTAKAGTPYVVVAGEGAKTITPYGEKDYVVDPGFNGYEDGDKLDADVWSGDINAEGVTVVRNSLGDQRLQLANTEKAAAVSTTISGLVKGENYVAEAYVENNSDAKATISVDAGDKVVSNYTYRSFVRNSVASDSEHGTKMQRIQISFVAESETAVLTLAKEAGAGNVQWEDIRIVKKTVDNFKEDGSFVQDFESVVQGLYPFVLGSYTGGDSQTHLSQLNAPYTQHGWNGRVIDDVIDGEWSLKHHTSTNALIYQTIPQNFRFEPGKVYTVEFDYQTGCEGYQMVVGDGTTYARPTEYLAVAAGETKHVEMQVIASGSGNTWIGIYQRSGGNNSNGQGDFVLDNLVIKEDPTAEVVTIGTTDMYLGDTTTIYGTQLDKIVWEVSEDGVIEINQANNTIKAIGAGEVTVTATFPSGTTEEFTFVVLDEKVADISRTEYPNISSSANTEEATGEPAGSGVASAATDGNSSTYWHSQWNGTGFAVSENNPAVLTVDLGTTLEFGGFKFQQRPSANNGIVQVFSYRILDADKNVVAEGGPITTDDASRAGGAWAVQKLDETVNAQFIEISVLQGQGGFAAISEVEPILVEKITLDDDVKNPFIDVNEGDYYYDPVLWAVEKGITTGTSATTFSPNDTCTRGAVVTFLWRAAGCPEPTSTTTKFVDINASDYYYKAVLWAVEEGITTGTSETTFAPNEGCTRGQVVTFLFRASKEKAPANAENTFTDVVAGAYYQNAVLWAVANGITTGTSATTFEPDANCTRGQIVTFIYRSAK